MWLGNSTFVLKSSWKFVPDKIANEECAFLKKVLTFFVSWKLDSQRIAHPDCNSLCDLSERRCHDNKSCRALWQTHKVCLCHGRSCATHSLFTGVDLTKRSGGYVKKETAIVAAKLNIRTIKILMSEVTQISKRAISCVHAEAGRVHRWV